MFPRAYFPDYSAETLPSEEGSGDGCDTSCPPVCPNIFERLIVFPTIRHGTRVEWVLGADFRDPGPYTYVLEVGRTGVPDADDWVQVGEPADSAPFLFDDEDRVHGVTQWTHYRVRLTTPREEYVSLPTDCLGRMGRRDWARAQNAVRQFEVTSRTQLTANSGETGWLLKRRLYGEPCTTCLDHLTRAPKDAQCPVCYGTGIEGGYFEPYPCFRGMISPTTLSADLVEELHMEDSVITKGTMLGSPLIHPRDYWVSSENDLRWGVAKVTPIIQIRGTPILVEVVLCQAEMTDVIYTFPIPDHPPSDS